jgi:hypothetical protein
MPIAKQFKGTNFYGCLCYVLGKEKAKILSSNLFGEDAASLAKDFEFCCRLNSRVRKKVYHAAISLPTSEPLDDAQFKEIAKDYLRGMGFGFKQADLSLLETELTEKRENKHKKALFAQESLAVPYVVVRHQDTDHHHIHIVAGRVRCDKSCVSEYWDYRRSERVLRLIEKHYGLSSPKSTPILQEMRNKIDAAKKISKNWEDLKENLEKEQIQIYTKNQGLVYKYENRHYKGNTLGINYTLSALNKELEETGLDNYETLPSIIPFTPEILNQLASYTETLEKILKLSKEGIYQGKQFTIKKTLNTLSINLNQDPSEKILWAKPQENRNWILRNFKLSPQIWENLQTVINDAQEKFKTPQNPPPILPPSTSDLIATYSRRL